MKELGAEANALIEAARSGDEPSDADRERVRASLTTRLLAGAAAGLTVAGAVKSSASVVAASGAGGTSAASASIGLATKALVIAGLAATIGLAAALMAQSRPAPVVPTAPTTAVLSPAPRESPAGVQAGPDRAGNPPSPNSASPMGGSPSNLPTRPVPVVSPAAPWATRAPSPVAQGPKSEVAAEVRLLRAAHTAMGERDADRALLLLDEHARRFPQGALGEERDATRIAALCALGRVAEAKDAAERFLSAAPRSLQAAAVRASCGGGVP